MYLTSTSTTILLLSEKIDSLQHSFDWIVGGIGIVVAVVLALIGIVQYLYTKKLTTQEIDSFKSEIRKSLESSINEEALNLRAIVDSDIDKLRSETREEKWFLEGDIARSYALKCEELSLHGHTFTWWLKAACHYSATNSPDLLSVSVKGAREALNKIEQGDPANIEQLWEKMTENQSRISDLGKKHPTEAKLLENLMCEKASISEKTTSTTTSTPPK